MSNIARVILTKSKGNNIQTVGTHPQESPELQAVLEITFKGLSGQVLGATVGTYPPSPEGRRQAWNSQHPFVKASPGLTIQITHLNNPITFAYHFSAPGEGLSLPKTLTSPQGQTLTAGGRCDSARTQTTAGRRGELLGSRGSPGHVGSASRSFGLSSRLPPGDNFWMCSLHRP